MEENLWCEKVNNHPCAMFLFQLVICWTFFL